MPPSRSQPEVLRYYIMAYTWLLIFFTQEKYSLSSNWELWNWRARQTFILIFCEKIFFIVNSSNLLKVKNLFIVESGFLFYVPTLGYIWSPFLRGTIKQCSQCLPQKKADLKSPQLLSLFLQSYLYPCLLNLHTDSCSPWHQQPSEYKNGSAQIFSNPSSREQVFQNPFLPIPSIQIFLPGMVSKAFCFISYLLLT